jgi:hypothetical protein
MFPWEHPWLSSRGTYRPGNYIVDITLTGYAPIHKVISVDKGGKAVIDEVVQHE